MKTIHSSTTIHLGVDLQYDYKENTDLGGLVAGVGGPQKNGLKVRKDP